MSPSEGTFHAGAWRDVWQSLDSETQDAIKAKAQWERMSLSAVMMGWWPDLWARVQADPRTRRLYEREGGR